MNGNTGNGTGVARATEQLPLLESVVDHDTGEILAPGDLSRWDWQDLITRRWQDATESIIEVGRLLVTAKAMLPHGEWGQMFENGEMPFSQGTAIRLMRVGGHPFLSNSAHVPNLPPSWGTLYELSKLPEPELEHGLETGKIHPDMARADVTAWWREIKQQELDEQVNELDIVTVEDEPSWRVARGQVWRLGNHLVMCGDAFNPGDRARLTGGVEVDALISDPPYGIDYQPDWKKWDYSPSDFNPVLGDDIPFDPEPFLDFPTVALFGANYYSNRLPLGGWICWDKRTDEEKDRMFGSPFELAWFQSEMTSRAAIMIRVLHGGVVNADSVNGNNERRYVATQKPVRVMAEILERITHDGSTVLDPFAGSGSTLLACEATGRTCLAMEISPENVAIILERWHEGTGVEPCLA